MKAFKILQLFTEKQHLTFSEINAKLNMPLASLYRFLSTLLDCGLLGLDNMTKQYSLGPSMIYLGSLAINSVDIIKLAIPFMEEMKEKTGETISLFVRHDNYRMCVAKVESDHPVRYSAKIGALSLMHGGASGNVLMSGMTKKEIDVLEALKGFPKLTERTPTDRKKIDEAIEKTRRDGYSISYQERQEGTAGVGVPIFDHRGKVVASLNITLPSDRFDEEKIPAWVELIKDAGKRLSQKNGYAG
jgi:IclR family acetate operon transcriptional repressor